nr:NAD(P)/FAD-dependent oxidoreductase [Magnetospirillum molischianum]
MRVHETDAVVVGAGPVGLFAVFQCGMVKVRCHVVDALGHTGGQLSALYPEKPIYDIPGHPRILASHLIEQLAAQAAPFEPVYHLGVTATTLTPEPDGRWRMGLGNDEEIVARAVILASGGGAFAPKRPPLEGLEQYEGSSVFYSVPRREAFRDKRIVIAGGGDSAVDWAISLSEIAAKVSVVHRRARFRAAPGAEAELLRLVEQGRIELVIPTQLQSLEGENGHLEAVIVATLEGETRRLPADALLAFFGLSGDVGPVTGWNLAMDGHAVTIDPASGATNRAGIFACGDICTYPGKLRLILTGFAEAARAAHSVYDVVHPGTALHFVHSTTAGVPGE